VNPEAPDFGIPQKLFATGLDLHPFGIWMNQYAVASQGRSFLFNHTAERSPGAITAVVPR
jgi:hypothetical protein